MLGWVTRSMAFSGRWRIAARIHRSRQGRDCAVSLSGARGRALVQASGKNARQGDRGATQHQTGHGGRWNSAQVAALRQHPEVELAEARFVPPAPVRAGSGAVRSL